jgi:hypothetical protein
MQPLARGCGVQIAGGVFRPNQLLRTFMSFFADILAFETGRGRKHGICERWFYRAPAVVPGWADAVQLPRTPWLARVEDRFNPAAVLACGTAVRHVVADFSGAPGSLAGH